jgi:farnesyl diphosphate synthase
MVVLVGKQTILQTELGQLMDLTSQPMDGPKDLDRFTLERYRLIVKYKTAFYSFYLPIVSCTRLVRRSLRPY